MVKLVVLFLGLSCAHNACAAIALIDRLEAGQHQTIVVYGTSLSAGGAWVPQLFGELEATYPRQITLINGSMSGKASNSGVANLETNVLVHNPDVVFIEFAVNDAFVAYEPTNIDFGISSAGSQTNLNSMIDSILAQNPDCEIILQTMNPAWDAPNGNQSGSKRHDMADARRGAPLNSWFTNLNDNRKRKWVVNWLSLPTSKQRTVTVHQLHSIFNEMGLDLADAKWNLRWTRKTGQFDKVWIARFYRVRRSSRCQESVGYSVKFSDTIASNGMPHLT